MEFLKSKNLTRLENKNVAFFGSGSSASELISVIYSLEIHPRQITLLDSFRSGHIETNFGLIEIKKITTASNLSEYDVVVISSINWDQIVSQWSSLFPISWFVEANELMHFANPISQLGDFYISESFRNKYKKIFDQIYNSLIDDNSKNLFNMLVDLRSGGSEYLFSSFMLEMKSHYRKKYEFFTKKRKYDLVIDGGIFDGNEIPLFREMLETHGHYYGFEPNSHFISSINKEFLDVDSRLTILNFALWDKKETLKFNSNLGAASGIINEWNQSIETAREISAVPIDEIFENISGIIITSSGPTVILGFVIDINLWLVSSFSIHVGAT